MGSTHPFRQEHEGVSAAAFFNLSHSTLHWTQRGGEERGQQKEEEKR